MVLSFFAENGPTRDSIRIIDDSTWTSGYYPNNMQSIVVKLYKSDGTLYKPSGYSSTSIPWTGGISFLDALVISGIDRDYAFRVVVVVTKTISEVYTFELFMFMNGNCLSYAYERMKMAALQPKIENSSNYMLDTSTIYMYGKTAKYYELSGDMTSAQVCLDRAYRLETYNLKPY